MSRLGPHSIICRVCTELTPSKIASKLFEGRSMDGLSLAEVVALVGNLPVRADEVVLPAWCCFQCQLDVEMAYRVRVLCQESDRKLREMLAVPEALELEQPPHEWKMEVDEPIIGSAEPIPERESEKNDEEENLLEELKPSGVKQRNEEADTNDESEDDSLEEYKPSEAEEKSEESDTSDEKEDDLLKDLKPSGGEQKDEGNQADQQYSDVYEEVPCEKVRCCGCRKYFETRQELLEHSKIEHAIADPPEENKIMKLCEICYSLIKRQCFSNHQRSPKTVFRCKECGDLFTNAKKAISHHQMRHYCYQTCCSCDINFETVEALREHSNQVHLPNKGPADKDRPFVCNVCYRTCKSYKHLHSHRISRGFKRYQCSECNLLLNGPLELQRHEQNHKNPKVCKCPICKKTYASYDSLRNHLFTHQKDRYRFTCEYCSKKYQSRVGLVHHKVQSHGVQGKWQCESCPKSFTKQILLRKHRKRFHMAENPNARTRTTKKNLDQDEPIEEGTKQEAKVFEDGE